MRRILSIFFIVIMVAFISNQADAQSLMQTAKKAEQRAKELRQQEISRYNDIIDSRDLTKYNQFISDYPRSKRTPEIKRRADEVYFWDEVKSNHTIAAYEDYLNLTKYHWFDNEANSAVRSLKQKAEKQEWDKVAAINTIPAYQQYLQENPSSGYRSEAENAINRIQGTMAWKRIKDSNDIAEIQNFIKLYPHASELSIATIRLHELKGLQHFNNGNLGSAYSEFSQISRDNVSYVNRKAYDDVMEYNEFSKLGAYASEATLLSFMKKYPNSKYTTQVSNMVAVAKARNLGEYASSHDYNQALSYAKDSNTINSVVSYISLNKKIQKNRIKAAKSLERKRNGGSVNLGLDFLDLGLNGVYDNCTIWYYNVGLIFRFGNFKDRIQFAIGLKPGIIGYTKQVKYKHLYYDDEDYDFYTKIRKTAFHLPIVGQLKLNLFKTSENSRFFLYGKYVYNAVRVKRVEKEMAWGAGLGFAWKHFDWLFYYQQDIGNNKSYSKNQHYFGMSMIYYWQL